MQTIPTLSEPTYRIESELGAGGGGVVYKAWHTRLQKYVVIKELKSGSKSDMETQRNEVEALKNVKSAYLPQVFDFLVEENRVFTVMEFIEGESFDRLLERGQRFSQPQVVKWYGQLASALAVIHKRDVCHRDVKPANIMLMPNGDVCLIDFNAALVSGNDVQLVSRSLGYASPEQYAIYEHFKNARNAPIHYGSSSVNIQPMLTGEMETELLNEDENVVFSQNFEQTELLQDGDTTVFTQNSARTAIADYNDARTEFVTEITGEYQTEISTPSPIAGIDWQRSDIYSLGATMYHLLTGMRPPERAAETIPVPKAGRFGEGIVYVIEQSMRLQPSERFASVAILAEAIQNIHTHDTRWKVSQSKKLAAAIILPLAFSLCVATGIFGHSVMAQEKEDRYYSAVYAIEHSDAYYDAYHDALSMFRDRIDPYRAMAERLWDDGDFTACREYIEENIGNIARFQAVPEMARSFGDMYHILGNCYYLQPGEPDYNMAKGNFEIAVRYVTDNPVYFRDYAISLARTGDVSAAESVLEKAKALHLDSDSLHLLNGEIAFVKQSYESALIDFQNVITHAEDDELRYRALHTSDTIYKLLGRPDESIALLTGEMNRIPLHRVPEMTERLADAYVKNNDYANAIQLFEQLAEGGAPQFHVLQGLAILYQTTGDLASASDVLTRMADAFPRDYRVPMRQAFLEADKQSKNENESRDYTLTKQYYDTAAALYTANIRPGESDPEMQQLDTLIEQLQQNQWIE